MRAFYTGELASDNAERIWLLPDSNELPMAVFDSSTKTWKKFESVRDAILEFLNGRELFVGDLPRDYRPSYSPDGKRVTYVRQSSPRIKYYDGNKWQRFEKHEIGFADNEDPRYPFFDGKEVHPFLKNPPIRSVRVDRFGNTWFQTGTINHIMLPAKPQTLPSLSVESDKWGQTSLSSLPKRAIEWRLPRGNCEHMHPGGQELGFLPSGDHEIEFRILTDQLDVIGPISKKLSVAIPPAKQLDHLITILRDGPDVARESAVAGLARQPVAAIPALKSAIESGDCWWLDAVLQEIERQHLELLQRLPS